MHTLSSRPHDIQQLINIQNTMVYMDPYPTQVEIITRFVHYS